MRINKSTILIGIGSLNLIHGVLHILQFIQSVLLVSTSVNEKHSGIDSFLHSPVLSVIWAIIGLVTLYIGIKDFKHHNNCHD